MQTEGRQYGDQKAGLSNASIDIFADLLNHASLLPLAYAVLVSRFWDKRRLLNNGADDCVICHSVDAGAAAYCLWLTSSHFCSTERQFRFPLEYGGQRTPTAQWTATASGSTIPAVISALARLLSLP